MANRRKKAKGATIVLEHSTPNKESDVTISPDSLKKNGTQKKKKEKGEGGDYLPRGLGLLRLLRLAQGMVVQI